MTTRPSASPDSPRAPRRPSRLAFARVNALVYLVVCLTWATPLAAVVAEGSEDEPPALLGVLIALSILAFFGLFILVGFALYLAIVSNIARRRRLWAILLSPLAANLLLGLPREPWQIAVAVAGACFFGYSLYLPDEPAWWERRRWAPAAYVVAAVLLVLGVHVAQRSEGDTRTSLAIHVVDGMRSRTFGLACRYDRAGRVTGGRGTTPDDAQPHPRPEAACRALESVRSALDEGLRSQGGCPRDARSGRFVGVLRDERIDVLVRAADIRECSETAFLGGEAEVLVPPVADESG